MRINSLLESLAAEMRGSSLPTDELLDEWAGLIDRYAKERAELLAGTKKSIGCKYDCGGVSLTPPQIAKRTGITLQAVHQRIAAGVRGKELLAPRYAYSKKRTTKEPTK